jgi:hypothetical protein
MGGLNRVEPFSGFRSTILWPVGELVRIWRRIMRRHHNDQYARLSLQRSRHGWCTGSLGSRLGLAKHPARVNRRAVHGMGGKVRGFTLCLPLLALRSMRQSEGVDGYTWKPTAHTTGCSVSRRQEPSRRSARSAVCPASIRQFSMTSILGSRSNPDTLQAWRRPLAGHGRRPSPHLPGCRVSRNRDKR